MNNRLYKNHSTTIHRLADQAHEETLIQYYKRLETEHPGDVIFYDMFNQRFAELIVRQCASLAITGQRGIEASFGLPFIDPKLKN